MSDTQSGEIVSTQRFSVPKESAAPESAPLPKYREGILNFADNEKTVDKARNWVASNHQYCRHQQKRDRSDDLREIADSMWRVDKTRSEINSEESDNVEDTRADFPSVGYFEAVKTITSGETSVILGNSEDLPMEYEPLPGAEGYILDEGIRVSDDQNAVLAWSMERKDANGRNMYDGIRSALFYLNKYGNQVLEMEWDYRVDERTVSEPIFDKREEGEDEGEVPRKVIARKFKKKKVVIANNPKLNVIDLADCTFDVDIPNVQDQNYFDIRRDMQLADVWQLQRSGTLMNVGKIRGMYLNGEYADEKEARENHRGGSGTVDNQTNLVEIHKARIRLPIDPETGEWDEDTQIPTWFETWWAGDVESGNCLCLAIIPNPHHCKKIPVEIVHAFEDDNGALHLGNPELLKSGYSMLTTIMNQYFDNVSSRNQLPFIVERGSIGKKFLTVTAGGNRIIFKEPGFADPVPLNITDTTSQTFTAMDKAEDLIRRAAGINKPLLGEGLGSRASASEAINTLNQALKPALEDAKYKADQILPFIAEWIMDMTRQFANPDDMIAVKFKGAVRKVYPGRLWGDQLVRVVAIKKLQDNILRVQAENTMMTSYLPVFGQFMTEEGMVDLGKQIAKNRDFDNVDSWYKIGDDYDARHVAMSENEAIVLDNVVDFPSPSENHDAHIDEHESFVLRYTLGVPDEDQNKEGIANMKRHIDMHKQFMDQRPQPGAPQAPEGSAPESAPRTVGEAAGDLVGGAGGTIGNAETAETGRPPLTA